MARKRITPKITFEDSCDENGYINIVFDYIFELLLIE